MSGLSREPFSRICFTSEPHRPEKVVSTRTQSCAGSASSSTSSSRTGAKRETNACRSTRPPMAETASRARLCRNTSAFTSTLLRPGRPPEAVRYLTLIRVPSSAPWQISRITPAAATSNTCMVSDCSLARTNALVSMMRTPVASASS